eukprot:132499-Rhodomonas_salina.1
MAKSFILGAFTLAITVSAVAGLANPGFPRYFSIVPENTPGVQGVPTDIDVRTFNYGSDPSNGVEVTLSFNDWGATYGGWQPIGTETIDLGANGNSLDTFTHTFAAAAHTCLQAKITDPGDGGNSDESDDTIQINWDVISADDATGVDLFIPFGNADGEEIMINGTEIVCVNNTEIIPCPGWQAGADGVKIPPPAINDADGGDDAPAPGVGADTVLEGNMEIMTRLIIAPGVMAAAGLDEITVMVRTEMGPKDGPREQIHAMVTVISSTVDTILNKPHLCCIKSIKMRVMLESILADALDAYDAGDCKLALKLLRMFVQKAKLLECELTDEEIKCLQKAIQEITAAGFMIVREKGHQPAAVKGKYLREAMFFRRSGLYEAALLEASKGC